MDRKPGKISAAIVITLVVFMLPVVYFLSTGPAALMYSQGLISEDAWDVI